MTRPAAGELPNGPGDPAPAPAPARPGWRDIRPDLAAEPYLFADWDQGVCALALLREL